MHWTKVKLLAFPLPFMKLYTCAAHVTEFGNLKTLNVQFDTLQNKKPTQTSKVKNKILIENVRNMLVCVCFFYPEEELSEHLKP